jgi:hypothetical protein
MTGTDPVSAAPLSVVFVREVDWQHEAAVALRRVLASELQLRYGGHLGQAAAAVASSVDVSALAYTGVAFASDGLPVGHAALCWNSGDLELRAMCVTPFGQPAETGAAVLAAAENAARRLRAQRIIVFTRDGDPVSWYRQARYELILRPVPYQLIRFPRCYGKEVAGTTSRVSVTVVEKTDRAGRPAPGLQSPGDGAGGLPGDRAGHAARRLPPDRH